ncbi:hypothetical protein [Streptomyces lydicamycinicus]|nr:hypothetical protein [Streptomyces lydicamycinicus]
MPMTDEVFDPVTDGSAAEVLGFWRLPGGFERLRPLIGEIRGR